MITKKDNKSSDTNAQKNTKYGFETISSSEIYLKITSTKRERTFLKRLKKGNISYSKTKQEQNSYEHRK